MKTEKSNRFLLLKASEGPAHSVVLIDNKGFEAFNAAINAQWGAVWPCLPMTEVMHLRGAHTDKVIDLWCDDEALLRAEPEYNELASRFAGTDIFGDALVMFADPSTGESDGLPLEVAGWMSETCKSYMKIKASMETIGRIDESIDEKGGA